MMLDPKLDLTSAMIVIMMWLHVHSDRPEIPHNVIEGIVLDIICEQNIAPLSGNRRYITNEDGSRNKPRWIEYNWDDNWMGPIPWFPDKSFECSFQIRREMFDVIINNLAKNDSFSSQTVCWVVSSTICLNVKLFCSQKILCYGISGSSK